MPLLVLRFACIELMKGLLINKIRKLTDFENCVNIEQGFKFVSDSLLILNANFIAQKLE